MNLYEHCLSEGLEFKQDDSAEDTVVYSTCPKCGMVDRFIIWVNQGVGGRYLCRKCRIQGDFIQYLRDYEKMNFQDACEYSGNGHLLESYKDYYEFKLSDKRLRWHPKEVSIPDEVWQEKSELLIEEAQECLWNHIDNDVWEWLKNIRCLNDITIKRYRLGFLLTDQTLVRYEWGLDGKETENGFDETFWIPRGIVIPHVRNNQIVGLRIRRLPIRNEYSKYYIVPGSSTCPFCSRYSQENTAIVVESELDAILLSQAIPDDVLIIALGAPETRPDAKLTNILNDTENLLISLDTDEAGYREYFGFWKKYFPHAFPHFIPKQFGKDPTEARLNGLDIMQWYRDGIEITKGKKL